MYLCSKYNNSSTNLLLTPCIVQMVMMSMVAASFVTEAPAYNGWHDNRTSVRFKSWAACRGVSSGPAAPSSISGVSGGSPGAAATASATNLSRSCMESTLACTSSTMVWVSCTTSMTWSSNSTFAQFVAMSPRFSCPARSAAAASAAGGTLAGGMAFTFSNILCSPTFASVGRGGKGAPPLRT